MIVNLQIGSVITPRRVINSVMIQHWRYAKECANIYGGMMPGTLLKVVKIARALGDDWWIRVQIPGRDPAGLLKIAGGELSSNFTQSR